MSKGTFNRAMKIEALHAAKEHIVTRGIRESFRLIGVLCVVSDNNASWRDCHDLAMLVTEYGDEYEDGLGLFKKVEQYLQKMGQETGD